jgi:transcriptional regulator with XRE-family HTH domain
MSSQSDAQQKAFGLAVRKMRSDKNLSQEEFADIVGVHRTYVGSVERGERNISLKNIHAFATALDCEAYSLLQLAEEFFSDLPARTSDD